MFLFLLDISSVFSSPSLNSFPCLPKPAPWWKARGLVSASAEWVVRTDSLLWVFCAPSVPSGGNGVKVRVLLDCN